MPAAAFLALGERLTRALVMITPLTALSASALSTQASNSPRPSNDITFMDLPGTSQVMVATPSASTA